MEPDSIPVELQQRLLAGLSREDRVRQVEVVKSEQPCRRRDEAGAGRCERKLGDGSAPED